MESSEELPLSWEALVQSILNLKELIAMADLYGFDASQVEPTGTLDPIPAGKYLAVITESEMNPTSQGQAHCCS